MKIFTFILSIYILALSLVPCTDGLDHSEDNISTEISSNHNDHDHSTNCQDECTPFCVCACCGSLVVMPTTSLIVQSGIDLFFYFSLNYTFDYSFVHNEGVWRPPSIG